MEWNDDSIVVAVRSYGDSSTVLTVLSRHYGRRAGLVRGGAGRRKRGILQPGNRVFARWRARLAEQLGTLDCELTRGIAANLLFDAGRLTGLASACAIVATALPEHEPCPQVFDSLARLLSTLETSDAWLSSYAKWELGLLSELGFGLELAQAAATSKNGHALFVSPQMGRVVAHPVGEGPRGHLLAVPSFLLEERAADSAAEIAQGLVLTGYFLEHHVYSARRARLPAARTRLLDRVAK